MATAAEEFQPAWSPDGADIAYLENRTVLKAYHLATRQTRTILDARYNYSYADGDQNYQWSPDSKWFLVQFAHTQRMFTPKVGIIPADGKGQLRNLTESGYDDVQPKRAMDGQMMLWLSTRGGALAQAGGTITGDVYGVYFTKAFYDRARPAQEDFALLKESGKKDSAKDALKAQSLDWEGMRERVQRLTIHASPASDWALSIDGEKLFYLTEFEKGHELGKYTLLSLFDPAANKRWDEASNR